MGTETAPGWGTIGIRQQGSAVLLVIPDFRWLRSDVWAQHPKVRRATRNALQTLAAPGPVNAHDGYTP